MRRRILIIALNVAVVATLVGGVVGYLALDKTVTLSVDGREQTVRTFGGSVSDVLDAEGIDLGEHDVVAPDPDASIDDGTAIAVRYGRELTVEVDGETDSYWVTATTVDGALEQVGLRTEGADLSTSRSTSIGREGLALEVATPKQVTVVADGDRQQVTTTGTTVGAALEDAGVELGRRDEVRPREGRELEGTGEDEVVVTRVTTELRTRDTTIGYDTRVREDDTLEVGTTDVAREGEEGVQTTTYRVVLADGEVRRRVELGTEVVTEPVTEVQVEGTMEPEPEPEPEVETDTDTDTDVDAVPAGGVWDDLAACESGGDWSIDTGNGYYGGLQFSLETWQAYGGSGYPNDNSREAQIAIAEQVVAANGGSYGSWPACAASLGLPT